MSESIESSREEADSRPASVLSLDRYEGARAELAYWSAQLLEATAAGNAKDERAACIKLCHLYTDRGTDLDLAITLARRALSLADDAALRVELAGWLSGLGDPGAAAAELESAPPLEGRPRTRSLIQAGVLFARARRANSAADILERAAALDPGDPLPLELLATLANWAEETVSRERGALAYIEAARRREAQGDDEAALEDLLRGFELHRVSEPAVSAVVRALEVRGRGPAADEVLRDFAATVELEDRPRALDIHRRRLQRALEHGDIEIALSTAFDVGLGAASSAEIEPLVDDVLARVGLHDLVATRLGRRAPERSGAQAAALFESLARLASGTLDDPRAAAKAFIAAAAADPTQHGALDALRSFDPGDRSALVEALVRIVEAGRPSEATSSHRAALALELATLAETELADPVLCDWALERAAVLDDTRIEEVALARSRIEPSLAERDDEITRVEGALESARGEALSKHDRLSSLRRLVALYGRAPAFEERRLSALASICRAEPDDEASFSALELCFARVPGEATRVDLFETVLRARLDAALSRRAHVDARLGLVELIEPRGARLALEEALPLLELPDVDPRALARYLVLASAVGSGKDEGRALSLLSAKLDPGLAAVARAAAADAYRKAGALADARREAEAALDRDPGCVRAASALASVAAVSAGRDSAASIERALGLIVPRAWLCDALARSLEAIGEQDLAFAWTQRWLALAPGDRRAISELLRRCQQCTDPRRLSDALNWVLAQADPPSDRVELFFEALSLLFGLERTRAGQVARRALDVYGPLMPEARERLASLADEHDDAGLAIALLERHIAADPEATGEALLELSHRRLAVGDQDGAARELFRAAQRGVDADRVVETIAEVEKDAGASLGSDGLLSLAEAKALCLKRLLSDPYGPKTEALGRKTVEAHRALGALRWDLAHDPRGAEMALFEAAEIDPGSGFELYAHDLAELAGAEKAALAVFERSENVEPTRADVRVALGLAAAHIAAEHGLAQLALDASLLVLAADPANPEAIATAEASASQVPDGARAIDRVYSALGQAAMGMFGRRAAHYRAARQLERLGEKELAQKHALLAFEAVPTEGTNWGLLTRLVDPTVGSSEAVTLFLRLAAEAKGEERAQWYRRAIELSGTDRAGQVRRFDLLLQALSAAPDAHFVGALRETIAALRGERALPEDADDRALAVTQAILRKVEGPDGARLAALLGRVLAQLGVYGAGLDAIRKAVEIDGELEVFDKLHDVAPLLADAPDAAASFVDHVLARSAQRHALVGPPLLRFASALADSMGDSRSSADLLAEAERREVGESGDGPASLHDADPFADPSMLDSEPPPRPSLTSVRPAEPPPAEEPSPPSNAPGSAMPASATPASAMPSSAVPSSAVPDTEPQPAPPGLGSLFDEPIPSASASASARFGSSPARSRRASSTPEFRPVRDGFDALFFEDGSGPEAEEPAPSTQDVVDDEVELSFGGAAADPEQALPREADLENAPAPADDARRASIEAAPAIAAGAESGAREEAAPPSAPSSPPPAPPTLEETLAQARSLLAAGDYGQALQRIDALPSEARAGLEVGRLRVDILRGSGDGFSFVLSVDQLVGGGELPASEASTLLLEASRIAFASGDEQGALIRTRRAAKLAPDDPEATLACAVIEYTARGMGTPREAQAVVETLTAVKGELSSAQAELRTFLMAEALDVIQGGGAGLRELSTRHAEFGALPLIALGMAERLLRTRSFEAAAPLFEQALAGDLRGLRNRARVSLAAADAAIQAGLLQEAAAFLEVCELAPETRGQVERRRREIRAYDADPTIARPVLEELVMESSGLTKARFLQRLARITATSDFEIAVALYEEALGLARRDRPMSDKIRTELLELIESRGIGKNETIPAPSNSEPPVAPSPPPLPSVPPISSTRPDSAARPALNPPSFPPSKPVLEIEHDRVPSDPAPPPAHLSDPAPAKSEPSPPERTSAPLLAVEEIADDRDVTDDEDEGGLTRGDTDEVSPSEDEAASDDAEDTAPELPPIAEAPPDPAPVDLVARRRFEVPVGQLPASRPELETAAEEALFVDLSRGYVDAGDALVASYADLERRARDVLIVRRFQAALRPGHRPTLQALRDAAAMERDEVYVRALDHALSVETGRSTQAPPLFAQPAEPQLLSALLFRDFVQPELTVLGLLWEAGMYRRELASYQLSGADRVPLTAGSVVGEAYSQLAGHLGQPRVVFQRKQAGEIEVGVALLQQPALIVSGTARAGSPELLYRLAAAHASTSSELILAAHLETATLKRLFEAVMAGFGPVRPRDDEAPASSTDAFRADVARIAAELWQRVNPAAERKLREITETSTLDVQRARRAAGMAMRRAGLFATGDLELTLNVLAEASGVDPATWLREGGLDQAASESAEAADAIRLAVRAELAEARWQLPPPSSIRR